MPTVKQEKMDVTSEDSRDDQNTKSNRVQLKEFQVLNTSVPPPTYSYGGSKKYDTISKFRKELRIEIVKRLESQMELEFDMIGIDPSFANAIRRILISEVPSMAIEKVYIYNNTSIIQDEVLAHRLGQIPIRADPRKFDWYEPEKTEDDKQKELAQETNTSPAAYGNSANSLEFELKVRCKKNANANKADTDVNNLYIDHNITTKYIKWIPRKGQIHALSDGKESTPNPGPVEDDIIIAKLRPGHELDIRMVAIKGVGKDHAKFSPVATAYYRLLPEIRLNHKVCGEAAERLQRCFSQGVIELVEEKSEDGRNSQKVAVVKDARYDGCSRNVYRYEDLKDSVTMSKVSDHFIFTVESTGALLPENLVLQSIDILAGKCDTFLKELDRHVKRK